MDFREIKLFFHPFGHSTPAGALARIMRGGEIILAFIWFVYLFLGEARAS